MPTRGLLWTDLTTGGFNASVSAESYSDTGEQMSAPLTPPLTREGWAEMLDDMSPSPAGHARAVRSVRRGPADCGSSQASANRPERGRGFMKKAGVKEAEIERAISRRDQWLANNPAGLG